MSFNYETAAKLRVSGLGNSEILSFLELVPEKYRDKVFSGLKPIPGFRPDEPRELKERIKKLANRLSQVSSTNPKGIERDWNALGAVWAGWLQITYKKCVDEALRKYEIEKFDFEIFLNIIISHEDGCRLAREDVNEIYKFSPFSSMDTVGELVLSLSTRTELAKQHEVKEIKARLLLLDEKIENLKDAVASLKCSDNDIANQQITKLKSELAKLLDEFQKFEKRSHLTGELVTSQNNTLGKAFESLIRSNEGILKQLQSCDTRVSALDKSNAECIGAVKRIEGVVKVLQKSVVEYDKERAFRNELTTSPNTNSPSKLIEIEHCYAPEGASVSKLDTAQKLQSALTTNYQAIGLGEKTSKKLAFTVATAILAGQFTQFVGPLGDVVADATLSAVAGKSTVAWDVPAGLCDGSSISFVMGEVAKYSPSTHGLLLRGFNKSAFDVYGYELKKILVNRLLGIGNQAAGLILISTALKSDSFLPIGVSSVELGPVVDTALLTWIRPKGKIIFGQMQVNETAPDTEEQDGTMLRDLANQIADMPVPKSELWRRAIREAQLKLSHFVNDDTSVEVDVVESLLMHWVFPWIALQCSSSDEVGKFIRENIHVVDDQAALGSIVEKYLAAA